MSLAQEHELSPVLDLSAGGAQPVEIAGQSRELADFELMVEQNPLLHADAPDVPGIEPIVNGLHALFKPGDPFLDFHARSL